MSAPRKRATAVTVEDIAREVGLSASSVSAVLGGRHIKRRIAVSTVEKVQNAARKLGYVPNVTARSLRAKESGTTHVVISILTSFEAPVLLVGQALEALDREIALRADKESQFTVSIQMFHAGRLSELPGLVGGQICNGAIIANTIDADDHFLASAQLSFPVVLLGRRIPGYAGVAVKSEMIGRRAAEVLIESGRKRLAVLQSAVLTQATRSRLSAFLTTVEHRLGTPPIMITCESLQERAGYEAMKKFLSLNPKCDGIFAVTDSLAIGAYPAIKASGRTIPGDIAMIGVGDNPSSHFVEPPLSGFESSEEAQNTTAVRMLLDLCAGARPEHAQIDIPVSAVLRESTGHPSLV